MIPLRSTRSCWAMSDTNMTSYCLQYGVLALPLHNRFVRQLLNAWVRAHVGRVFGHMYYDGA